MSGGAPEEHPGGDERLLRVAGTARHDTLVRRVEPQGCRRRAVGDKVDPEKLHRDETFRKAEHRCEEDAEDFPNV
jgi:hypothetical protein